jgi:hypothetical protein
MIDIFDLKITEIMPEKKHVPSLKLAYQLCINIQKQAGLTVTE